MATLAKMQRDFIHDCLSGELKKDNVLLSKDIDVSEISAFGLMGIYQTSALANITHSLKLTYPVIEKLVGNDFFRATCKRFIATCWPESGNMDDYGAELADFLSEFEHAKHLTYLKDVARLEWAFHLSSLADDADVTDWSTLSQVNDILQIQFVVTPSLNLISSTYPIDKIWQLNQDAVKGDVEGDSENNGDVSLDSINATEDEHCTFLALYRREYKTVILPITLGEFVLLSGFYQRHTFEKAIVDASEKQADISIDETLKKFIELGIISGFVETD